MISYKIFILYLYFFFDVDISFSFLIAFVFKKFNIRIYDVQIKNDFTFNIS
jgi:hypothetical protein